MTNFSEADAAKVHELEEKTGVKVSALGYYPNPLSPNREESETAIEHIKKVIRATKILGLPGMNTFVGRDWSKSVDENWPRFLEVCKPLIA